ncbi:MAG: cyclase family protein [Holophagales bacterium]|nr:cyclase family protein [Holophagales bacterium]
MRKVPVRTAFSFFAATFLVGTAVVVAAPPPKLLDLTYPFEDSSIYWPTATSFKLTRVSFGPTPGGWWYASNDFTASEHGGTHADAPIHFARGGRTIDQIPLEEWIGPAVKVDVSDACDRDRDYMLTVDDLRAWEKKHGRIPAKAWVVMYTGLDTRFYPDPVKVLGTALRGAEAIPLLSFPGFSPEAATFLVKERSITGIALDTPSIDRGRSPDFKVHQIVCGADRLALENLAAADRLPAKGATLHVIPMLIKGGSGAPARVFATIP